MKKIVCDLCEGTEFVKQDGFFVCQGCGTKYSLSEAKSMMKEVEGGSTPAMGTATPAMEVAAPIGNPNQAQIDNILVLATTAFESSNNAEAENYCNRAIEIDATGYKAWFLKGKAVGWSSTYDNPRIQEAAHSFCKAIDFAPEEEREDLKTQAVDELKRLGLAHMDLCRQRFGNWPEDSEYYGFGNAKTELINALTVLLAHGNAVDIPEGYLEEIADMMALAGMEGALKVKNAYFSMDYPGSQALQDAINMMDNCASIMLDAINSSDDDDEKDIDRYENLITIYTSVLNWSAYDSYGNRSVSLNREAKKARNEKAAEWRRKIEDVKKAVADKAEAAKRQAEEDKKKRIAAYWEVHADEKNALDSELAQLLEKRGKTDSEIKELDAQIDSLKSVKGPIEEEVVALTEQIDQLTKRRSSLGMFAGKEKKQLTDEIASLQGRINSLSDDLASEKEKTAEEVNKKLIPAQKRRDALAAISSADGKRIDAIHAELEKDPEESADA